MGTLVVGAAQALLSCWWFHLQGSISWAVNSHSAVLDYIQLSQSRSEQDCGSGVGLVLS